MSVVEGMKSLKRAYDEHVVLKKELEDLNAALAALKDDLRKFVCTTSDSLKQLSVQVVELRGIANTQQALSQQSNGWRDEQLDKLHQTTDEIQRRLIHLEAVGNMTRDNRMVIIDSVAESDGHQKRSKASPRLRLPSTKTVQDTRKTTRDE